MYNYNSRFKTYFTLLIILYPILAIYGLGNTSLNIADTLMILISPLLIISIIRENDRINNVISGKLTLFCAYIIIQLPFVLLIYNADVFDTVGTAFRYSLYLIALILFQKKYFDIELGLKIYKYVSIISAVYIILQTVSFRFFGYYLTGTLHIPFFPIMSHQINNLEYRIDNDLVNVLRPRAFFAEPVHYSQYIIGNIIVLLFRKQEKDKNKIIIALFLSLSLIFSTSSTGILCCALVWGVWVLSKINAKIDKKKIIPVLFVIILFFVFSLNFDSFSFFMDRMEDGSAAARHFDGYKYMFDDIYNNTFIMIFGHGMGKYEYYLPGLARIIYYYGLFGTIIFAYCIFRIFTKQDSWQKILLLFFLILSFGTECLFQPMCIVYFSLIIWESNLKYINKENKNDESYLPDDNLQREQRFSENRC